MRKAKVNVKHLKSGYIVVDGAEVRLKREEGALVSAQLSTYYLVQGSCAMYI